jgi:hypothetical protein
MTKDRQGWAGPTIVWGVAPPNSRCVRCDEDLLTADQCAWLPGLHRRGPAHCDCRPPNLGAPESESSSQESPSPPNTFESACPIKLDGTTSSRACPGVTEYAAIGWLSTSSRG